MLNVLYNPKNLIKILNISIIQSEHFSVNDWAWGSDYWWAHLMTARSDAHFKLTSNAAAWRAAWPRTESAGCPAGCQMPGHRDCRTTTRRARTHSDAMTNVANVAPKPGRELANSNMVNSTGTDQTTEAMPRPRPLIVPHHLWAGSRQMKWVFGIESGKLNAPLDVRTICCDYLLQST